MIEEDFLVKPAVELIAEVDFATEVARRQKEDEEGVQEDMFPPVTKGDIPTAPGSNGDSDPEKQPDSKTDAVEKQNFNVACELTDGLIEDVNALPTSAFDKVDETLQKAWLNVYNKSYEQYEDSTKASRIASGVISNIGRKNRKGVWVPKRKRNNGTLEPIQINKNVLELVMSKVNKIESNLAKKNRNEELKRKKEMLLDKLLNEEDK